MNFTRLLDAQAACKGLVVLALFQASFLIVRLASAEGEPQGARVSVVAEVKERDSSLGKPARNDPPVRPQPVPERSPGVRGMIAGIVRGADGGTLAATLFVRPEGGVGGRTAQCDPDGRFRVQGLDPATKWVLRTDAPGHLSDVRTLSLPAADLRIVLRTGQALVGHVEGEDGRGLEGVTIQAVDARGGTSRTVTDPDGRYELEPPEGGTLSFTLVKKGYETLRTGRLPLPPPGAELDRFRMQVGITFRGKVLDGSRGTPIEGARILATAVQMLAPDDPRRAVDPAPARTDGDGTFEMPGMPSRRFLLTIEAEGFSSLVEVREIANDVPQTFSLEPGRRIEGVVRLSNGQTVAGVQVVVLRRTRIGTVSRVGHPVRTDEEGKFRIDSLPNDEPLVVHVYRDGSVAGRSEELSPGSRRVEQVVITVE